MAIATANPHSASPLDTATDQVEGTARLQESTASLPGWIDTFYRTYKGKRLGPYHVRKWRVGKKIKRQYIKAADLEAIRAACKSHKELRQERTLARHRHNRAIDNFNFLGAMMTRVDRGRRIHPLQADHVRRIYDRIQNGDTTGYTDEKPRFRFRRSPARMHLDFFIEAFERATRPPTAEATNNFMGAQNA